MNFLADECCSSNAVLRDDGHDVIYFIESLRGLPDADVLNQAFVAERILLTEDKDFGELVYRLRLPARGIILIRFDEDARGPELSRVRDTLRAFGERLRAALS